MERNREIKKIRNRRWALALAAALAAIVISNIRIGYRVGVDGVLYEKKIPLYAKACGYLYRDWAYRDIVKDIISGKKDDLDKILAILSWTRKNIRCGIPAGLRTVDDHPLNIVIRQYGCGDQLNDVFTILCSYAGYRAGMTKCFNSNKTRYMILSLVRVKEDWLIFDVVKGKYFMNKTGKIGSVGDYLKEGLVLYDDDRAEYKEFLDDLRNTNFNALTRAEEQMPFRRIQAQVKGWFNKLRHEKK